MFLFKKIMNNYFNYMAKNFEMCVKKSSIKYNKIEGIHNLYFTKLNNGLYYFSSQINFKFKN